MMNATATYIGRDAMGFHRVQLLDGEHAGSTWCVAEYFEGEREVTYEPEDQFVQLIALNNDDICEGCLATLDSDGFCPTVGCEGDNMEFCPGCEAPLNADGTCARC